jgi:branched-chain amino acid transport system substrate-binding protein
METVSNHRKEWTRAGATEMYKRLRQHRKLISIGMASLFVMTLATSCGSRVATSAIVKAEGGGQQLASVSGQSGTGPSGSSSALGSSAKSTTTIAGSSGSGVGASSGGGSTSGGGSSSQGGGGSSSGGTSSGGTPSAAAVAAGCTKEGSPLIIGQDISATGIIGADIGSAKPVLAAWVSYVNSQFGGLQCHPVQLYSEDDQSDPNKAASNVNDLVQNKHAVALVANYVPISISGFRSALDQNNVPAVGGDLFALDWDQDPLMYPVGTGVEADAYGSVQSLAAAGHKKVAVLYCVEAAICPPYNADIQKDAGKAGATVVYSASVSITQPDYTAECEAAKNAGATQIAMIVDGGAVDRLAASCKSIGYVVPYAIASLGATFSKTDPNIAAMTATIASQAVPWILNNTPAEQAFQTAMKTYAPGLVLDPTTTVAWADGMMLQAAINQLGTAARGVNITTAMIRQGLAKIQNEALGGLISPQSYSPSGGPNPPNQCYFPAFFNTGSQWTAPLGSNNACLQ